MQEIWRLDGSRTRSLSAENPAGAKGAGGAATTGTGAWAARKLGVGWKVSPSIELAAGATATLADVAGPGVFRHLWLTTESQLLGSMMLRMYWDNEPEPAIELPLGAFFCTNQGQVALLNSQLIVVAPACGLNSYFAMPFRAHAKITLENRSAQSTPVYYQFTYLEQDVPKSAGYLHAQWRNSAPLGTPAVHTVVDGVRGHGRYVGTYMTIQPNANGWWGEGEFKFYLDGDGEFPTICGTGTEDYFGGAWNFDINGRYQIYSTPYLGLHEVLPPDQIYQPTQQFGMYRWHVEDPICFAEDLRVTVQALGWQADGLYLPLAEANVATTAYWYQNRG
jgi:hypothetical protein